MRESGLRRKDHEATPAVGGPITAAMIPLQFLLADRRVANSNGGSARQTHWWALPKRLISNANGQRRRAMSQEEFPTSSFFHVIETGLRDAFRVGRTLWDG